MPTAGPTNIKFKLEKTEAGGRDSVKYVRPQRVLSMNWGKGLVVLGSVGGKATKFLVDTGAAISIMSIGMFKGLSDHPLKLQTVDWISMPLMGEASKFKEWSIWI